MRPRTARSWRLFLGDGFRPEPTRFAASHSSYALDNSDLVCTFNWQPNEAHASAYPDLQGPFADRLPAVSAQAVDMLRRHGASDKQIEIVNE